MVVAVGGETLDWAAVPNGNQFRLDFHFPNPSDPLSGATQANRHIKVLQASYGENCDDKLQNNFLAGVRSACDGQVACSYTVPKVNPLDVPISDACANEFQAHYDCGVGTEEFNVVLRNPLQGSSSLEGYRMVMSCHGFPTGDVFLNGSAVKLNSWDAVVNKTTGEPMYASRTQVCVTVYTCECPMPALHAPITISA